MKRFLSYMAIVLTAVFALASCNQNKTRKALLPNITGKAGEVIVVIDKGNWEGALGAALRDSLACEAPYLPQREPLFALVNVPQNAFTSMFQVHRNIVVTNVNPTVTEPGLVIRKDVWAAPQTVMYLNAPDVETAVEIIQKNTELMRATLEQAERDRIIGNIKKDAIDGLTQGILVYKYPVVEGEQMMSLDNILENSNRMLEQNVPGMFENTYMTTSTAVRPGIEYKRYKGLEFAEIRGFWEVYNDYMGGPFVSHAFYSQDGQEVIVLQAFVYAPKYDKRQYLRQVESVIYSFEWAPSAKEEEKN